MEKSTRDVYMRGASLVELVDKCRIRKQEGFLVAYEHKLDLS